MISSNGVRRLGLATVASAAILSTLPAFAQDITDEHLKAAHAAVNAIGATDPFDLILPQLAGQLKQTLIQKNPDMQVLIEKTVDDKTIALAPRRADLEKEASTAYAKVFSADELTSIATFYESDAGKKLIAQGPVVIGELRKAAEIWQRGIARDLSAEVAKTLDAAMPKPAPAAQTTEGQAPAPAAK